VSANDVVEDDFQRPRPCHAHRGLDEHCEQDNNQGAPIGAHKTSDQTKQSTLPYLDVASGFPADIGATGSAVGSPQRRNQKVRPETVLRHVREPPSCELENRNSVRYTTSLTRRV